MSGLWGPQMTALIDEAREAGIPVSGMAPHKLAEAVEDWLGVEHRAGLHPEDWAKHVQDARAEK